MGKLKARTGAQALVESLARAGVSTVFGYPGGNVVSIFDALDAAPFRFVLGRHEQGCVHAADGYARASGRTGVAIVTSGPGATNALTGLATANVDGVPLVLVSGQVPLSQIGTDAFQEADMTGMCRAATKHSFLVKSADEIPETVAEAFYIATHGKPGTVVIDLPRDVQEALTMAQYPERIALRAYHPDVSATTTQVNRLAKLLNEAIRPIIYAGGGVIASNAARDVAALAHKAGIPVVTTLMGLGSFPADDPLALGMAGMYGTAAANLAIDHADVILALGVRFSDRVTGRVAKYVRHGKIVHVDCDPSSIDKNVTAHLGIVADIKDLLTTVNARVRANGRAAWCAQCAAWRARHTRPERLPMRKGVLAPQHVLAALMQVTHGDAIFVTDVGQNQMWCAQMLAPSGPRHFLTSGGMGTMGFALPAAIGAALARPEERVIAIAGDGGFQMTSEELAVAVAEKLPITVIILNNRCLGLVRQMQKTQCDARYRHIALTAGKNAYRPDFVALARAYGAAGLRVDEPTKLAATLTRAVRMHRPCVVEVLIDPATDVQPLIPWRMP